MGPAVASAGPSASTLAIKKEIGRDEGASAKPPRGSKPSEGATPAALPPASSAPAASGKHHEPAQTAARPNSAVLQAAPSPDQLLPSIGVADVQNLEEKIGRQLIATPPVRGRSMTTVTVENIRILLSAWEVAAFYQRFGTGFRGITAPDCCPRHAVHLHRTKKTPPGFQGAGPGRSPCALAKFRVFRNAWTSSSGPRRPTAPSTWASASKRLLSLVEEAEQLQKGSEPKQEKR